MYAVIKTGGKQYRVQQDDRIMVERLAGEAGQRVRLGEVLMIADGEDITLGAPMIEGAAVDATVVEQARGDKIIVFKKRRRHNYRRTKGHRQDLTLLKIDSIMADASGTPAPEPAEKAKPKRGGSKDATKDAKSDAATPFKKSTKGKVKKDQAPAEEAKTEDVAAQAAAPEAAAPATEAPEAKAPAKKDAKAEKPAEDTAAEDVAESEPAGLLSAPDGDKDDLKKISGVGPKLEGVLNELGVYHYRQIAAWTPENVAWVDNRLKFKGRIERDGWIEQAKELDAGKEG